MNIKNAMIFFKPYFWRLVFTILGCITAILFLVLGFAKTILILLCCSVGYLIGMLHDKKDLHIFERFQYWRNKW